MTDCRAAWPHLEFCAPKHERLDKQIENFPITSCSVAQALGLETGREEESEVLHMLLRYKVVAVPENATEPELEFNTGLFLWG